MRIRRRIKLKALEERSKRRSTFTKRRKRLFKKTKKFCKMADTKSGVIVFSKDGNAFGFGRPAVEEYIDRYQLPSTSAEIEAGSGAVDGGAIHMEEAASDPPLTEVERRLIEALESDEPEWDVVMKDLGMTELDELQEAVMKIQRLAAERVKKLKAAAGEEVKEHDAC